MSQENPAVRRARVEARAGHPAHRRETHRPKEDGHAQGAGPDHPLHLCGDLSHVASGKGDAYGRIDRVVLHRALGIGDSGGHRLAGIWCEAVRTDLAGIF